MNPVTAIGPVRRTRPSRFNDRPCAQTIRPETPPGPVLRPQHHVQDLTDGKLGTHGWHILQALEQAATQTPPLNIRSASFAR